MSLIYFIYLRLPLFLLLPTNGASPVCSVLSPAKGKHRDTNGLSATDRNMKTCRRAWHKVPKRHVQLVRATQNIMLCFYWMEIKILVQTPWQRSDERENSELVSLLIGLFFCSQYLTQLYNLSVQWTVFTSLAGVYMIFGIMCRGK